MQFDYSCQNNAHLIDPKSLLPTGPSQYCVNVAIKHINSESTQKIIQKKKKNTCSCDLLCYKGKIAAL